MSRAATSGRVPRPPFDHAWVVGAGLVGGSLALALRERAVARAVSVCDPDERARAHFERRGYPAFPPERSPSEPPDALFLAAPPEVVERDLERWLARAPHAVTCDVASLKRPVLAAAERARERLGRVRFVGAHPLAGSERHGAGAADPALFAGRPVALCPLEDTEPAVYGAIERVWLLLGARPLRLDPDEHDRAVAITSHLPMLAAAALAGVVAEAGGPGSPAEELVGPALHDTTRPAASPPDLWLSIFERNADAVAPLALRLGERLGELGRAVAASADDASGREALRRRLVEAAGFRHRLEGE